MLITSVKIIKLMLFEGYFLKIIVKTCMINVDKIGQFSTFLLICLVIVMADDEKKEAGDKNDHRRLHSFPLIRVSFPLLRLCYYFIFSAFTSLLLFYILTARMEYRIKFSCLYQLLILVTQSTNYFYTSNRDLLLVSNRG